MNLIVAVDKNWGIGRTNKDTGKGDLSVGNYCDGRCDEWFGELELE